mgnify:CR=1 FL=1
MAQNEIQGVKIVPLRRILDERGNIMHMFKVTDPEFTKFGEIYFSTIFPDAIKGWHLHSKMTLNYAAVSGNIKLVLFDMRKDSPTKGVLQEVFIGEDNYCRVSIPPGVLNGFKAVGNQKAIVANCTDIPHDPGEISRIDPFSKEVPYTWDIKHG